MVGLLVAATIVFSVVAYLGASPAPRWTVRSKMTPLRFSADGNAFFSRTNDRLEMWDARSGRSISRLLASADNTIVAESSDGRFWAAAPTAGPVEFADSITGRKLIALIRVASIEDLRFSPDGSLLAVTDKQHVVRVFTISQGDLVETLTPVTEKSADVPSVWEDWRYYTTSWGPYFLCTGPTRANHAVFLNQPQILWDTRTRKPDQTLQAVSNSVLVSSDGKWATFLVSLAPEASSYNVMLWNLAEKKQVARWAIDELIPRASMANMDGVLAPPKTWAAFSPNGKYLAVFAQKNKGDVSIIETKTGEILWRRPFSGAFGPVFGSSEDFLILQENGRVKLFDVPSAKVLSTLSDLPVNEMILSSDGETALFRGPDWFHENTPWEDFVTDWFGPGWLSAPATDNPAVIIDLRTGTVLLKHRRHERIMCVAPDRQSYIAVTEAGVEVWDLPPRRSLSWLFGPPLAVGLIYLGCKEIGRQVKISHGT